MSLGTALADDHPLECGCVRALIKTGGCLLNHPPNEGRLRAQNGADCIERIWYGPSGQHASPRPAGSGGSRRHPRAGFPSTGLIAGKSDPQGYGDGPRQQDAQTRKLGVGRLFRILYSAGGTSRRAQLRLTSDVPGSICKTVF